MRFLFSVLGGYGHLHPLVPPDVGIVAPIVGGLAWIVAGGVTLIEPVPPDWPTAMTAEPERRWRAAEQAFYRQKDLARARRAVAALAASKPPEPARASAEFGLLLLAAGERKDSTRSRYFTDLARRYPDALAPSGVSVADLSLIHALRRSVPDALPEALWGELVYRVIARPSFLTVALLEEAERSMRTAPMVRRLEQLQRLWLAHERTRRLLRALARQPSGMIGPAQVWLQLEGHSFLALSSPFAGSTGGKEPPAGNAATCTLTINSFATGPFTANATADVTMGGVTVHRSTSANSSKPHSAPSFTSAIAGQMMRLVKRAYSAVSKSRFKSCQAGKRQPE